MICKHLMEEKQLDFNQPLLSVRRFSSTVASDEENKRKTENSSARLPPLPAYKSELKSGPVRNPGTVPFVWEQAPGRPKDENKLHRQVGGPSSIPITPNLPPGRGMKVKQKGSDKASRGTSVTKPRKESSVSNSSSVKSINEDVSTSLSVTSVVTKCESPKEAIQEKKASSVSDDGDEAYQDALDTLSRTESFFMNCSVSGLSGLDEQEAHLSRSISQDQFARAFMIDRFLPAAQAVASETPPKYSSKKPPVAREQPRQVKKVMGGEGRHPVNQHRPNNLPPFAQELCREESEDEDDLYSEFGNNTGKICGLFPRFCLLNPIPGLRMQDRMLNSPVHGMHARLSAAPHSETLKTNIRTAYYEKKSADSKIGSTEEKYSMGIRQKSKNDIERHGRGRSTLPLSEGTHCDTGFTSPVVEKTLYVDSVQKVKSYSGLNASEINVQTNHQRDDFEISRKDSKLLTVADEKPTLSPKGSESLDLFLSPRSDRSIDDMQIGKTNLSNKLGNQGRDLHRNSSPKVGECEKIDSARDQESFHGQIQTTISCRKLKSVDDAEAESERQEAPKSVYQGPNQDFGALANPKVAGDGKVDSRSQRLMKLSNQGNSDIKNPLLPLALPLPKAPSESWLNRTLPIVSLRNTSLRSSPVAHIHGRGQSPKWETIVKSSNLHHEHLRSSEELLAPIPEA